MRVLVIDGDALTANALELMLSASGFNVTATNSGEEGADLAKLYDYDVITLELVGSDITGLDVLRRLRAAKVRAPVLVLTTMFGIAGKVKAFALGADDYLTKPFHKGELVGRLNALVRRSKGHAVSMIEIGNTVLNIDTKTVTIAGAPIALTGKEYQMLELLALRKGNTIPKESFLLHLYGGRDEPEIKIIDVFICKLRKKMESASRQIETIWGRGYTLREGTEGSPSMASDIDALSDDHPGGLIPNRLQWHQPKPKPARKGVHIRIPATV